jgi:hypothetical protein
MGLAGHALAGWKILIVEDHFLIAEELSDAIASAGWGKPRMHAAAIVLDLVQPIIARRRFVHDTGELRLDPCRWPRRFSHRGNCTTSR